jgi:Tol biopolymer transport system component
LAPLARSFSALLFAALTLASSRADALPIKDLLQYRLDPALDYETLTTRHFEVHYPTSYEALARHVVYLLEPAAERVSRALDWEIAGKTHVVIFPRSDRPQVFTIVIPHRQIFLDATLPPTGIGLDDYADWYHWVTTHEYAHVVDLDLRQGAYGFLSAIFGAWVRPNLAAPPWVKEGLATYLETELTPVGRGSSTTFPMMIRMAAKEGLLDDPTFVARDTVDYLRGSTWPWTLRAYLFGYYLVREIAESRPGALRDFVHEGAGSAPYRIEPGLAAAGFDSFGALYDRTIARLKREADAELSALGSEPETPLEYLTDRGMIHQGLSISSDGKLLLVTHEHPDLDTAILGIDLSQEPPNAPVPIVDRSTGQQSSISRSNRFIVYDQVGRLARHYLVGDLYVYDRKRHEIVDASSGLRARDPDVHPDGKHIVFVASEEGKNRLLVTDTSWEERVDLLGDVGYRRISNPRYSPDGEAVAFTLKNELGGEDLWLLEGSGARPLVADGAQNWNPSWTSDGKMILYSSDRTGVSNIYLYDLEGDRTYRLTHTAGGLFSPVADPEGRFVYVISYRGRGYDVARFPWKAGLWSPVDRDISAVGASPPPVDDRPAEPYGGVSHLLPQFLGPSMIFRPGAFQIGASVGATDPLYFQQWELVVRYDSAARLPVGKLGYFNGAEPWAFELEVTHDAVPIAATGGRLRALGGRAELHVPLSRETSSVHLRPGVFLQLVEHVGEELFAGGSMYLRYDTEFKQLGYSFPESGLYFDAGVRQFVRTPFGGAQLTAVDATLRTHFPLPWLRHAIHLELSLGAFTAGAEDEPNALFYAGGRESFPFGLTSPYTLNGYEPNAFAAPQIAVATLQYTFPILRLERGLSWLPIFFERTSAAIRLQGAAIGSLEPTTMPLSAGLEIHQTIELGYLFGVALQLGLYQGLPRLGGDTQLVLTISIDE